MQGFDHLDLASFESHWRETRLFGLPAWRRHLIAIARHPAELPRPRRRGLSLLGADLAAGGVAGVVNAFLAARARKGVARLPLGTVGVLAGASGTVLGSALLLGSAAVRFAAERVRKHRAKTPV